MPTGVELLDVGSPDDPQFGFDFEGGVGRAERMRVTATERLRTIFLQPTFCKTFFYF